ncbi:SH3 domain-containing protein [uncultured Cocleimonas sp.]|uniref:SH3 domain-containing protein n=1 Tax=uncultured Cocleimonas sp. TaxID=1051587 RepID=UPI00263840DB|nr:SH3 domain-containing protein [uncultured Cocleimonas sp.]
MKRVSISTLIVFALITVDASITMAHAKTTDKKITIFKVNKVSPSNTLKLRAWPSTKSRIKQRLPYNAIDLTETGKQRVINGTKWVEVNWRKDKGWVNSNYLVKTGVLLRPNQPNTNVAAASRNNKSINAPQRTAKVLAAPVESLDVMPVEDQEGYAGDRYDQTLEGAATEMKTAFDINESNQPNAKMLLCNGKSPKLWNIKMNVANRNMNIKFGKNKAFNVPINYHAWATPNQVRMNIGGNQGRNNVEVNLEKTNACYNGLSKTRFTYEVNATVNREFYTGCCEVVGQ